MIDGAAAGRGVDPLELPLDRFCNHVHEVATELMSETERRSFDMTLERPLPGQPPTDGAWSDEELAATFYANLEES